MTGQIKGSCRISRRHLLFFLINVCRSIFIMQFVLIYKPPRSRRISKFRLRDLYRVIWYFLLIIFRTKMKCIFTGSIGFVEKMNEVATVLENFVH